MADSGVHRQLAAIIKAEFPTAVITSAYREGSITTSGNLSYHARGMAIDISPRMEIFQWIKAKYGAATKELIYSPAGRQQIKNGAPHTYTGAVKAGHYDHVHWAMESVGAPSNFVTASNNSNNPIIPDEIEALGDFYNFVTTPGIWVRVGVALGGFALMIIGLLIASKRGLNLRFK